MSSPPCSDCGVTFGTGNSTRGDCDVSQSGGDAGMGGAAGTKAYRGSLALSSSKLSSASRAAQAGKIGHQGLRAAGRGQQQALAKKGVGSR